MKTITLDEEAYHRLKSWKNGTTDSFSSVVKRVIPARGTLGSLVSFVQTKQTGLCAGNALLEEAVENRTSVKENPWM
jgi:predicted CopG family antitoxin